MNQLGSKYWDYAIEEPLPGTPRMPGSTKQRTAHGQQFIRPVSNNDVLRRAPMKLGQLFPKCFRRRVWIAAAAAHRFAAFIERSTRGEGDTDSRSC